MTTTTARHGTALLAAALLIASVPVSLGAGRKDLKPRIQQRIENFELPRYDNGTLVWKVVCKTAEVLDTREMNLHAPRLRIEPANQKPGYTITADNAQVTNDRKLIHFRKNVLLVSTEGDMLKTDALTWQVDTKTASSDTHIIVTREKMELSGVGLTVDSISRNFKIHSLAKMVMTRETLDQGGNGLITISSQGSLTFKDALATFVGRTTVQSDSGTIISDKLELHLNMKSQTIKRAVATGNINLASEELSGTSRKAEWTPDGGDISLSGNVKLTQKNNGNTVQAERADISPGARTLVFPGPATLVLYPQEAEEPK